MDTTDLIPVQLLCERYDIPISFLDTLQEFQLVEIIDEDNSLYIHTKQIKKVEKMMRLHYDLEINFEGLDAIHNLLNQVESLKKEVKILRNKLRFYQDL
ncbi:hypothetical protein GCM10007962_10410 [Yeosuana aromativorans]|jgi:hypothetical protein|uniref:MerR family transcriptional regulator n=1 Tax=Yeosuana aromativorans TaxID=288019 RepID=A0A8J3BFS5_9FLAO|nr:chaperone modulator CbpM [Yeosuana aromativorans]GGK18153.1 hypothetical protein GCM10007962_10410 [Yeosuana aromativorans]